MSRGTLIRFYCLILLVYCIILYLIHRVDFCSFNVLVKLLEIIEFVVVSHYRHNHNVLSTMPAMYTCITVHTDCYTAQHSTAQHTVICNSE